MPREDHITSFKAAFNGLRTDATMTLDEKVALLARARHTLSGILKDARKFRDSLTAQELNTNLQNHIDRLGSEENGV